MLLTSSRSVSVAALAATIGVLDPGASRLRSRRDSAEAAWRAFVTSSAEHRTAKARLSAFPHVPLRSVRGGDMTPPLEQRVAALELERTLRDDSTAAAYARVGVARLITGNVTGGLAALERAARMHGSTPSNLSDLAAAYLIKADASGSTTDLARALDSAQKAVLQDSACAAAWFNRAVALERLKLPTLAAESWTRAVSLETGGWRAEALDDARRHEGAPLREERLSAIARTLDSNPVAEGSQVINDPDLVTHVVEREILRNWATAVLNHEWERAEASRRRARRLADGVHASSGDRHLPDLVRQLTQASDPRALARTKAEGWIAYVRAVELWENDRIQESQAQLTPAGKYLGGTVPAANAWVELYQAGIERLQGRRVEARRRLVNVERTASDLGYVATRGRALWQRALLSGESGSFGEAFDGYRSALLHLERARDRESTAVLHALIADQYLQLGATESAWVHQARALEGVSFARWIRRDPILSGAAALSAADGLHAAAVVFRELPIRDARAADSSLGLAFLLAEQATDLRALRMDAAALETIAEARRLVADLDPGTAAMARALQNITESQLIADSRPERALELLSESVRLYERRGDAFAKATTELRRGQLLAQLDRLPEAESAFRSGVAQTEKQRGSLSALADVAALQAARWDLYTELADLYLRRNDPQGAFDLLHRGRLSSTAPEGGGALSRAASRATDRLTIVFGMVRSKVLAWVHAAAGDAHFVVSAGVEELEPLVRRHGELLRSASNLSEFRDVSTRLFDLLLGPVRDHLAGVNSLIVVPDGALSELAFGALIDARRQTFLVEQIALSIAPALPAAAHTGTQARRLSSVLVLGNPNRSTVLEDRLPSLPHADTEAAAVASLYERSTLLTRDAATKRSVLKALPNARAVHFAGHAVVNPARAELSRLLLTPDRDDALGALFGGEIDRLRLQHLELAVLAGCGTASARATRGAGVLGLARAFLYAGAQSVVATLWPIDDRESASLFVEFHRQWIRGRAPADALRAAQVQALRAGRGPQQWAGVVAIVR